MQSDGVTTKFEQGATSNLSGTASKKSSANKSETESYRNSLPSSKSKTDTSKGLDPPEDTKHRTLVEDGGTVMVKGVTLRVQVVHTNDGTTLAELKEIDPEDAHRTKNRDLEQELPDGSVYRRFLVDDSVNDKYGR